MGDGEGEYVGEQKLVGLGDLFQPRRKIIPRGARVYLGMDINDRKPKKIKPHVMTFAEWLAQREAKRK